MIVKDIQNELQDTLFNLVRSLITFDLIDLNTIDDCGFVITITDGIAVAVGLLNVLSGELVSFTGGVKGMVISLEKSFVKILIFGNDSQISEGDSVGRTYNVISIDVSHKSVGHVLDSLGNILDNKPILSEPTIPALKCMLNKKTKIDIKAPGVITRHKIFEPVATGLISIDCLVPIGRGQRELIIGDKQTGKTAVAIDTIINQKNVHLNPNNDINWTGIFCVYVAIGQKRSSVVKIVNKLSKLNSMFYTTVISATASDAASLQYLAPYTGCTVGEWFRDNELHSLIIYDDLSKHAVAYRQMSLLLRRPPGREAYPGDVFFLHSRLLERASKLSNDFGAGSLTALPIIETQLGDVSALVSTNVISITDGQIYLDTALFNKGIRPALSAGISVSRVGAAAQDVAIRKFAGQLKLELAQYREVELFSAFASELDEATQMILKRGLRLLTILNQPRYSPLNTLQQLLLVFGGTNGFLDNLNDSDAREFKALIIDSGISKKAWFENLNMNKKIIGQNLNFFLEDLMKTFKTRKII